MRKFFINADVYTHESIIPFGYVEVSNGQIQTVGKMEQLEIPVGAEVVDVSNNNLSAGWIDLQVNGVGKTLFENASRLEDVEAIGAYLRSRGTTSWFGALISVPKSRFNQIRRLVEVSIGRFGLRGVHVEGPWINPEYRGCHPENRVLESSDEHIEFVRALSAICPVIVTVAPEVISEMELLELVSMERVTILAGHTDCSWAQSQELPLDGCTHLFNGMPSFSSRSPHALGWLIGHRSRVASIIGDGRHLTRETIQVVKRACWPDQLFLVSDIMPSDSAIAGEIDFLEGAKLDELGGLVNSSGTIAGANSSLQSGLKFLVQNVGVPMASAINMTTSIPARLVGRDDLMLSHGGSAELVSFDNQFNVKNTFSLD